MIPDGEQAGNHRMGLTSDKTLLLSVLFALLLFVGTVWLWPRLARTGWRAVSGRVGLLLATQLALFVSVGLTANQAFGFYASWADLFGRETDQGVVVDHAAGGAPAGPLRVVDTRRVDGGGSPRPQYGGQIQKVAVNGRTTHIATPAVRTCRRSTSTRSTARVRSPRQSSSRATPERRRRWWTSCTTRVPRGSSPRTGACSR